MRTKNTYICFTKNTKNPDRSDNRLTFFFYEFSPSLPLRRSFSFLTYFASYLQNLVNYALSNPRNNLIKFMHRQILGFHVMQLNTKLIIFSLDRMEIAILDRRTYAGVFCPACMTSNRARFLVYIFHKCCYVNLFVRTFKINPIL